MLMVEATCARAALVEGRGAAGEEVVTEEAVVAQGWEATAPVGAPVGLMMMLRWAVDGGLVWAAKVQLTPPHAHLGQECC